MGLLVLARHGQANFLQQDYDRLSPLGEAQSRLLGKYWAELGIAFDSVFTGPRMRQIRTAELAAEEFSKTGQAWPEAVILKELDEYDSNAVMEHVLPGLLEVNPDTRALTEAFESSKGTPDERRRFQLLFEVVMRAWVSGTVKPSGIECWNDFVFRVRSAIELMTSERGSGRRILAFTSGGPISVALQFALGISDEKTLELNWQMRNASLTEFMFSGRRFTLDKFNALPHLRDQKTWSYR